MLEDESTDRRVRACLVFGPRLRWGLAAAGTGFGAVAVAVAAPLDVDTEQYVLAHALSAAPFLAVGVACTARVLTRSPAIYRPFWRRWFAAGVAGLLATTAALLGVLLGRPGLLVIDMALIAVSVCLAVAATYHLTRARAGQWSLSVDVVDAVTALVVLGVPGLLLVAEPLASADDPRWVVPLALTAGVAPGVVYLQLVNLTRIPRGERVPLGIGVGIVAAATANATLQLAYVAGGAIVPFGIIVAVHCVNMGLLMALPLWAHSRAGSPRSSEGVARRRNPMPYVSAAVVPLLAAYVVTDRGLRGWAATALVVVAIAVPGLGAVRYTALTREARRLSADLARVADERRRLLAGLLRGLDVDRHRTATELHSQVVGSLAALGSVVQTAQATLPADVATPIRESVGRAHADLCERAEALRRLMVAMGTPVRTEPEPDGRVPRGQVPGGRPDDTLAAALPAFADELYRGRRTPTVRVHVDPELRLDWTMATIAYRIAQEALCDAARRGPVTEVTVAMTIEGRGTLLEIREEGDAGAGVGATGEADDVGSSPIELLAYLAGGELTVAAEPGGTRTLRVRMVPGGAGAPDGMDPGTGKRPAAAGGHLRLLTTPPPAG